MNISAVRKSLEKAHPEQLEDVIILGKSYKALPLSHLSGVFDVEPGGRPAVYQEAFWLMADSIDFTPTDAKTVTFRGKVRNVSNIDQRVTGAVIFYTASPVTPR